MLTAPLIAVVQDTSVNRGEVLLDAKTNSSAIRAVLSKIAEDGYERVIASASQRLD